MLFDGYVRLLTDMGNSVYCVVRVPLLINHPMEVLGLNFGFHFATEISVLSSTRNRTILGATMLKTNSILKHL